MKPSDSTKIITRLDSSLLSESVDTAPMVLTYGWIQTESDYVGLFDPVHLASQDEHEVLIRTRESIDAFHPPYPTMIRDVLPGYCKIYPSKRSMIPAKNSGIKDFKILCPILTTNSTSVRPSPNEMNPTCGMKRSDGLFGPAWIGKSMIPFIGSGDSWMNSSVVGKYSSRMID